MTRNIESSTALHLHERERASSMQEGNTACRPAVEKSYTKVMQAHPRRMQAVGTKSLFAAQEVGICAS